jgi:Fe-S cluster assembly iron-binding protein IscA
MLKITKTAIWQFKKILTNSEVKNGAIRVYSSGGGCCPSYGIDVVKEGEDGDKVIKKDGIRIYVEKPVFYGLKNGKISYSYIKKGFTVKQPSGCC